MKKNKLAAVLAGVLALALLAAGCGGSDSKAGGTSMQAIKIGAYGRLMRTWSMTVAEEAKNRA